MNKEEKYLKTLNIKNLVVDSDDQVLIRISDLLKEYSSQSDKIKTDIIEKREKHILDIISLNNDLKKMYSEVLTDKALKFNRINELENGIISIVNENMLDSDVKGQLIKLITNQ